MPGPSGQPRGDWPPLGIPQVKGPEPNNEWQSLAMDEMTVDVAAGT